MTSIVIATRSGLARHPDGGQFRLVRGKTLADARHPLVTAYPELFAPHTVDLPVDEPEADQGGYRAQLAAIAEGLHERSLVPADVDTEAEGWLATLVLGLVDRLAVLDEAPSSDPEEPVREPAALPKARGRRAPRVAPSSE